MRAQFLPWLVARAIHSHRAITARPTTITSVMVSGAAVRGCPSTLPLLSPMKGSATIRYAAELTAPPYMNLAALSTGAGGRGSSTGWPLDG